MSVHGKMVLALIVLVFTYAEQTAYCVHSTQQHKYNFTTFRPIFSSYFQGNIWALRVVPTLLYSWQFFDVVQLTWQPEKTWLRRTRQAFSWLCVLSTCLFYALWSLYAARGAYFLKQLNFKQFLEESKATESFGDTYNVLMLIDCSITIGYLLLTVRVAAKLAKSERFGDMQINTGVVVAHSVALIGQGTLILAYFLQRYYDTSTALQF